MTIKNDVSALRNSLNENRFGIKFRMVYEKDAVICGRKIINLLEEKTNK